MRPPAAVSYTHLVCLAGGVAANGRLRQLVNDGAQKLGAKVYLPELKPPFLCLVASGGHSHIVEVQDYTHYHICLLYTSLLGNLENAKNAILAEVEAELDAPQEDA